MLGEGEDERTDVEELELVPGAKEKDVCCKKTKLFLRVIAVLDF